jgi:hypothetical protein
VRNRLAEKGWSLAGDELEEAGDELLGVGEPAGPETGLLGGDGFDGDGFEDE